MRAPGRTRRCSPSGRASPRSAPSRTRRSRRCAPRARLGSSLQAEVTVKAGPATARAAGCARRRPALRAHHFGGARRAARRRRRRRRVLRRGRGRERAEVRALLALPQRRRPRSGAPDDLRPLHRQPVRRRRAAHGSVMASKQRGALAPWLGIAFAVIVLDQLTKAMIVATFQLGDARVVTPFFDIVRAHNRGAAFSFLNDASWLAALVLRRPGARRGCLHRLAARAPRRPAPVRLGARLDPRRRARQRDRPAAARPCRRLPPGALEAATTSRRSTSPTARSRSAPCCSILDELRRVRRSS